MQNLPASVNKSIALLLQTDKYSHLSGMPVFRQLARSGARASGHISSSIIPQ
jgi:hypothetical protein